MANRGSIERLTTAVGSGSAGLEIIAGAAVAGSAQAVGFFLLQMDISLAAATASVYQLGRPAAKGVTPTTPVAVPIEDESLGRPLAVATALAWGTPPTSPSVFLRGAALQAVIGASVTWIFNKLWIPAGASIVLWNGAANSAAYVSIQVSE